MQATGCFIKPAAQSLFFLDQLQTNGILVDSFIDWLKSVEPMKTPPHDLCLQELVLTISDICTANLSSALTIHCAQTQSNTQAVTNTPYPCTSGPPRPFCHGAQEMCVCGCFGHTCDNCRDLASFATCFAYFEANKTFCVDLGKKFASSNDRSKQASIICHLCEIHPNDYDGLTDDEVGQVIDQFSSLDYI